VLLRILTHFFWSRRCWGLVTRTRARWCLVLDRRLSRHTGRPGHRKPPLSRRLGSFREASSVLSLEGMGDGSGVCSDVPAVRRSAPGCHTNVAWWFGNLPAIFRVDAACSMDMLQRRSDAEINVDGGAAKGGQRSSSSLPDAGCKSRCSRRAPRSSLWHCGKRERCGASHDFLRSRALYHGVSEDISQGGNTEMLRDTHCLHPHDYADVCWKGRAHPSATRPFWARTPPVTSRWLVALVLLFICFVVSPVSAVKPAQQHQRGVCVCCDHSRSPSLIQHNAFGAKERK
jgi:hypothetical protein